MLFTFPSRYLFTIGRTLVLSLGRWSSRIPTGFLVSRGTWETDKRASTAFVYRTVTFYGRAFQNVRLSGWFVTLRPRRDGTTSAPATPGAQRSRAVTCTRFRLFPVRSPLLGESQLLSFPGGTEMVHFPPFASRLLFDSEADNQGLPGWVAPFGDPRVEACLRLTEAYRSLPRPSSPSCAKASTVCP